MRVPGGEPVSVWLVRSRADYWIVVGDKKTAFFSNDDAPDAFVQDAVARSLEAAGVGVRRRRADLTAPLEQLARGGDNGSEGDYLERLLEKEERRRSSATSAETRLHPAPGVCYTRRRPRGLVGRRVCGGLWPERNSRVPRPRGAALKEPFFGGFACSRPTSPRRARRAG